MYLVGSLLVYSLFLPLYFLKSYFKKLTEIPNYSQIYALHFFPSL